MIFKNFVKAALLMSGIFVGSLSVTAASCNCMEVYRHNYETRKEKVMSKIDGLFSRTQVTLDKKTGEIEVKKHENLFHTKGEEYDCNSDGAVERIWETYGLLARPPYESFYRNKDYQAYPKKFDKADKYVKEQLERFGLK